MVHAYAVIHGTDITINISDGPEFKAVPFKGTWDEARTYAAELDAFLSLDSAYKSLATERGIREYSEFGGLG